MKTLKTNICSLRAVLDDSRTNTNGRNRTHHTKEIIEMDEVRLQIRTYHFDQNGLASFVYALAVWHKENIQRFLFSGDNRTLPHFGANRPGVCLELM